MRKTLAAAITTVKLVKPALSSTQRLCRIRRLNATLIAEVASTFLTDLMPMVTQTEVGQTICPDKLESTARMAAATKQDIRSPR